VPHHDVALSCFFFAAQHLRMTRSTGFSSAARGGRRFSNNGPGRARNQQGGRNNTTKPTHCERIIVLCTSRDVPLLNSKRIPVICLPIASITVLGIAPLNTGMLMEMMHHGGDHRHHDDDLAQGHHARLRETISSFTDGLLRSTPALPGLDQSIVIAPRRLHLTLGVMTLTDSVSETQSPAPSRVPASTAAPSSRTVSDALSLLSSLKPRIMELLVGHRLCVPLQRMHIMDPDRGNPDHAHVLWLGPSDSADAHRLQRVGGECPMSLFVG